MGAKPKRGSPLLPPACLGRLGEGQPWGNPDGGQRPRFPDPSGLCFVIITTSTK